MIILQMFRKRIDVHSINLRTELKPGLLGGTAYNMTNGCEIGDHLKRSSILKLYEKYNYKVNHKPNSAVVNSTSKVNFLQYLSE